MKNTATLKSTIKRIFVKLTKRKINSIKKTLNEKNFYNKEYLWRFYSNINGKF